MAAIDRFLNRIGTNLDDLTVTNPIASRLFLAAVTVAFTALPVIAAAGN